MEKMFAISYEVRYAETSDWSTTYIKANDKEHALKKFAKSKKIPFQKFNNVGAWQWEEGVWLAEFRNIMQVKEIPCSHCNGTGIIHI